MFTIYGKEYYINIESITELCAIKNDVKNDDEFDGSPDLFNGSTTVDVFKYEIVKMCLERIFTPEEPEIDNFKIEPSLILSLNTLLKYGILKENINEDE